MIAVVDYRKGNLLSVERGLRAAGADARITSDAADILSADAVVLPGVGAFADAAATMNELGQMEAIRTRVAQGAPFLGICLGLHLMFAEGSEDAPADAPTQGLGFVAGCVDKMPSEDAAGRFYKVPHVGWNTLEPARGDGFVCPLLAGIEPGTYFYFTHSYIAPVCDAAVALTEHSVRFPSVVQAGPVVFGTQFHPEKSSQAGAQVLRNFVGIVNAARGGKGA